MEKNHLTRNPATILDVDVIGPILFAQQKSALAHERLQVAFHHFAETIKIYDGITHNFAVTFSSQSLKGHQVPFQLR